MPGKKMPPKKGLGLMIMIGAGKPKGKMGKPMKDDEESPAMERKEMSLMNKAMKKPAAKKPAAKKPSGIKTMPKGKPGSGSQGRGY
jgi:hypothetical protein